MKDRLLTGAGALFALLVLYGLFFQSAEPPVSRPVSVETGRNGYAAVSRWLERSGVPVESLRVRFDRLIELEPADRRPFPRRGNLLITTLPHQLPIRAREHDSLKAWIRSGNTLLILAALADTPSWAPEGMSAQSLQDLQVMTGLRFVEQNADGGGGLNSRSAGAARNTAIEIVPVGDHPLMEGVEVLRGFSDEHAGLWQPIAPASSPALVLRLASARYLSVDAAWQRAYGNGHIIIVASSTVLANHLVAESDAGRFLMNIVQHHVDARGEVIFDDIHQGLSEIYDASAFFRDPRLHRSLWFLLAAWLVYVLGSTNRLAPPLRRRAEPRQRDFIDGIGGFMARRLGRRDAGLLLFERWFEEVRRSRDLRHDDPPWDVLRTTPTLGRTLYDRLRRDYETLCEGRAVNLVRLHNALRQAREAIG